MLHSVLKRLFSADPKLHRLLFYWAGSALFYVVSALFLHMQARAGAIDAEGARRR